MTSRPRRSATDGPAVALAGYAAAAYAVVLAVFGYGIGFFADAGVPTAVDRRPAAPAPEAVAVDLLLLSVFAVQHSIMARRRFKEWWTRVVPRSAERATYVLASSLALALLFWIWLPIGPTLWQVSRPAADVIYAVQAAGWLVVTSSTFHVSHSDLFGLRQAWFRVRRLDYRPPAFVERGLYRRVRHPLMLGFVLVFWAAPIMSGGHLGFAAAATGYILVGIALEERDLMRDFGDHYLDYRRRVPALVPVRFPRRAETVSGPISLRRANATPADEPPGSCNCEMRRRRSGGLDRQG